MKRLLLIFFTMTLFIPVVVKAEYLFLRNGAIYEGKVLNENVKWVAFKRKKDGKAIMVSKSYVLRIQYTKIRLGLVNIHKTDGTRLDVYIVDEDRNKIIYRTKLYSPREYYLQRKYILFIAQKYPSNLEARLSGSVVELQWNAPFGSYAYFKIYKRKQGEKFKSIRITRKASYSIHGLKSNTQYQFRVTTVGHGGYESMPSNTVSIKTKKISSQRREIIIQPVLKGGYILPMGEFGNRFSGGAGGLLGCYYGPVLGNGFIFGIEMGYYYLSGRDEIYSSRQLPAYASGGYVFRFMQRFDVIPTLAAGMSYNSLSYENPDDFQDAKSRAFSTVLKIDVTLRMEVWRDLYVSLGAAWCGLIEPDGFYHYMLFHGGFSKPFYL